MNRTETGKAETDRVDAILAGYRAAAKEQLAVVKAMIDNWDGTDIAAKAVTAMAAENTAKTVRKLYQLNLERRQAYGLA